MSALGDILGGAGGLALGGIKSIIEGILHRQAVVRAAKANMFAFGGRPGVPYPDQPPSVIGNLVSGGAAGLNLAQNIENGAAQKALTEAQTKALNNWNAVSQTPPSIGMSMLPSAPQSSSQLGLDYSMPNSQSLLKKILMGE